jgi:hypothetical protein
MLELGKMEEGRDHDMNLYLMSCKAEMGLDSDRLPQELRECTPALQDGLSKNGPEIKSSVDEAGRAAMVT